MLSYTFDFGKITARKEAAMVTILDVEGAFAGKSLRVMITSVHEIFRHGLRNILIDVDGFEVVAEASNCSEMLKQAARMQIDVVLMGSSLPDAGAIEAIQHLRNLDSPPQVVLFSSTMDEEELLDALLAGASGYLTKDLPAKDVINALQSLQGGELALLPRTATTVIRRLVKKCKDVETTSKTRLPNARPAVASLSTISSKSASKTSSINFSDFALKKLTRQEYKVFQLMHQGLSNKQIATKLSISPYTVGKHVQQILRKLGALNRTQAVLYALSEA